jgi:DNA-binding CsgD family transcriptional regulator
VSTLARPIREYSQMEAEAMRHPELSPREIETLQLAADGETCASTAQLLGLAEGTVKHFRHSALLKLGADHAAHGVAQALRRGLIK